MSEAACGKEILCLSAENTAACSKYSDYLTPEELAECEVDAKKYIKLRKKLAERADAGRMPGL